MDDAIREADPAGTPSPKVLKTVIGKLDKNRRYSQAAGEQHSLWLDTNYKLMRKQLSAKNNRLLSQKSRAEGTDKARTSEKKRLKKKVKKKSSRPGQKKSVAKKSPSKKVASSAVGKAQLAAGSPKASHEAWNTPSSFNICKHNLHQTMAGQAAGWAIGRLGGREGGPSF